MKDKKMKLMTIYIEEKQAHELKSRCALQGRSVTAIIRGLVETYLKSLEVKV